MYLIRSTALFLLLASQAGRRPPLNVEAHTPRLVFARFASIEFHPISSPLTHASRVATSQHTPETLQPVMTAHAAGRPRFQTPPHSSLTPPCSPTGNFTQPQVRHTHAHQRQAIPSPSFLRWRTCKHLGGVSAYAALPSKGFGMKSWM